MLYDECTMGDLIIRAVARGGNAVAFVSDKGQITYREFGEHISQMSQALEARGLKRGETVACLSGNRFDAFLLTATCYVMGVAIVKLHPAGSVDDLVYCLKDSGAKALFV